jgi:hypothetical protein
VPAESSEHKKTVLYGENGLYILIPFSPLRLTQNKDGENDIYNQSAHFLFFDGTKVNIQIS